MFGVKVPKEMRRTGTRVFSGMMVVQQSTSRVIEPAHVNAQPKLGAEHGKKRAEDSDNARKACAVYACTTWSYF